MTGCYIRGSHIAHWTWNRRACPGIPYKDPRFRYWEELARSYVGLPPSSPG